MDAAIVCGLIILVLLVVMLLAGVPIALAIAISSVCAILPIIDLDIAVLTASHACHLAFTSAHIAADWESESSYAEA